MARKRLRALQQPIELWRALSRPVKEVFFTQVQAPDRLVACDNTHCTSPGTTTNGQPFPHLIYHFVLTESNWETGTICFSESFERLSIEQQNARQELGGEPEVHRADLAYDQ